MTGPPPRMRGGFDVKSYRPRDSWQLLAPPRPSSEGADRENWIRTFSEVLLHSLALARGCLRTRIPRMCGLENKRYL